ncbi:head GIN domain-containing protein [Longitalea luteola]|uniref:head GIN domain-containing protein n=1 Tax=Longitalea luteola TaxID=2812563 RepID=UPI001A957C9C|nr:head GIN domain-containing protein [Longitalea luteola]
MLKALLTPTLLLISLVAFSQEKVIYDANVEKRTVGGFQAIKVSDGIDLYLSPGTEEGVAVSAAEIGDRARIKTIVEDGELKIFLDKGWNWRNKKLTAYVAIRTISKLRASGGSDIIVKGKLTLDKLDLSLTGGSDFNGEMAVTDLTVHQSGGSDVHIKGSAVNVKVDASGGSDFKGYSLIADYAILEVSGGSDATITVNKEMAAEASGGSDVNYKGNPVIKYKSASGGGSISKRG